MKAKEVIESVKETGKEMLERGAKNRTGAALAPKLTAEMEQAAKEGRSPPGDERSLAALRAECHAQAGPIGSVPPPVRPKGMVSAAGHALRGEHVTELVDQLGARLAFERTGVRLYDTLLSKMRDAKKLAPGMSEARVRQIRDEEASHVVLVRDAIVEMGGDPTVVTPAADVQAVMSMGIPHVLQDPRTTVDQCLEAILVAELADRDSWAVLIAIARALGQDAMADRFESAFQREEEHLRTVRDWVARGARRRAGAEDVVAAEE
jgi:bacterioferritin (cytochrome b1)